MRHHTPTDRLVSQIDRMLHTLIPGSSHSSQPYPGQNRSEPVFSDTELKHMQGLMRVNHTGEVCAQALYQGQALTAKLYEVRQSMEQAADEEIDHLAWCEQRLAELGSRPSLTNPLWYGLSFAMGAFAGAVGDKISLGFVAATEDRVSAHLQSHLDQLPAGDEVDEQILKTMLADEQRHAEHALDAGGVIFPDWLKQAMAISAKLMTKTTYRL